MNVNGYLSNPAHFSERLQVDLNVWRSKFDWRKASHQCLTFIKSATVWELETSPSPLQLHQYTVMENILRDLLKGMKLQVYRKNNGTAYLLVSNWLESPLEKVRFNLTQLHSESLWSIIVQVRQRKINAA